MRVCSVNGKNWVTVLSLYAKRTLVLTLFVYFLAVCFCDRLSLPQMDSISSDGASGQPSPGPTEQDRRETENVGRGFWDLQGTSHDGYAPGYVSQNDYELDPCIQIW